MTTKKLKDQKNIFFSEFICIQQLQSFYMMPRHRGLGEECTAFFRKDARSNPAANSSKYKSNELETKQERPPANDHWRANGRARTWLDLKLVRDEQETRFKGCGLREREKRDRERKTSREDVIRHEAFPRRISCSKKQGQLEPFIFIKCYPSSWPKGEMERKTHTKKKKKKVFIWLFCRKCGFES